MQYDHKHFKQFKLRRMSQKCYSDHRLKTASTKMLLSATRCHDGWSVSSCDAGSTITLLLKFVFVLTFAVSEQ
jgi:hypothetical protein